MVKSGDSPKPFLEHLDELRTRIIRSLAVVLVLFLISNLFVDDVISYLTSVTKVPFVFVRPTEAFFIKLKIAFILGFFLSIPFLIYEAWKFIGVALSIPTRRWIGAVLPISYLLFCLGLALNWFVVLPAAMKFLMGFSSESLKPFLSIDAFVSFSAWMTLAFGGLFQLPLIVLFLVRMDIVDIKTISHYRCHVVAGLALLSAFLTPGPDPFSQLALLVPSYALFEVSLLVGRLLKHSRVVEQPGDQWNPE